MQDQASSIREDTVNSESAVLPAVTSRASGRHLAKLERALAGTIGRDGDREVAFAVWISGEAGSGKTQLVRAVEPLLKPDGVLFLRSEAHEGISEVLEPVLAAARILLEHTRNGAEAGDMALVATWAEMVAIHAPALHEVLPEVDWGREVEPYPALDPRFERNRLLDHLAGLFLRFAEVVPTVLHFDNAEHLGPLGVEFVETMARVVRTRREGRRSGLPLSAPPKLAVILSTEPDDRCPVKLSDGEVVPIVIRGLGRDEFGELLNEELADDVPLSVREKLYQQTRGNPLDLKLRFRLEARRNGTDGTALERAKRLIDVGSFAQEVAMFTSRLEGGRRRILQVLAVAAKPLSPRLLHQIADLDRYCDKDEQCSVEQALDELERDQWIRRIERGAIALGHRRMKDPVLATLSASERQALHGHMADAIEAEYENRPYRRFREVYHHRTQAGSTMRLVEAGFQAADESLRLYDFKGAGIIYQRLLDALSQVDAARMSSGIESLTDVLAETGLPDRTLIEAVEAIIQRRGPELDPEQVGGLWRRLGRAAGRWGFDDQEIAFYQRALASVKQVERSHERMKVYASLARVHLERHKYDDTLKYCRDGLQVSELDELTDDPEFLELCRVTQEIYFRRGDFVEAERFEAQYLTLSRQQGTPMETLESLFRLAHLAEQQGDFAQAEAFLVEAQPIAHSTGSRLLEARTEERMGYLFARQNNWPAAFDAFSQSLEIQSEIGDREHTSRLLGALGMVCFFVGKIDEGARNFRLFALYSSVSDPGERFLPPRVPGLPHDYRSRSERDERIRILQKRLDGSLRHDLNEYHRSLSDLANYLRDRGEYPAARAVLKRGLRSAVPGTEHFARFQLELGILHRQQGSVEPALDALQLGLDSLPSTADRALLAETNLQVGLLHQARGELQRALTSLTRGLRTYLELRHDPGVAHALLNLAETYRLLGKLKVAQDLGLAVLALSESLGIERLEAEAWLHLARVRSQARSGAGLQEAETAREIFGKQGILEGRCRALLVAAAIYRRGGDFVRARLICCEAMELARDLGLRPLTARGLALRGAIEGDKRADQSELPRAARTLETAIEHAQDLCDRHLQLRIHGTFARIFHQRSRSEVARSHLEKARALLVAIAKDAPLDGRDSLLVGEPVAELLQLYNLAGDSGTALTETPGGKVSTTR